METQAVAPSTPNVAYIFADGTLGSTPGLSTNNAILSATYFNASSNDTTNSVNVIDGHGAVPGNSWVLTLDSAANYWNTFVGTRFIVPTLLETFAIINTTTSILTIAGSSSVTLTSGDGPAVIGDSGGAWRIIFLFMSITQDASGKATSGVAKAFMQRLF